MAKRGGYPGMMPGNMNNMIRQVQKMQKDMEKAQEDLKDREVESSVGGGAVKVVANGQKRIVSIKIAPETIDKDDPEMLEDLVLTAVNQALVDAEEMAARELSKFTGGMNIPGLF